MRGEIGVKLKDLENCWGKNTFELIYKKEENVFKVICYKFRLFYIFVKIQKIVLFQLLTLTTDCFISEVNLHSNSILFD